MSYTPDPEKDRGVLIMTAIAIGIYLILTCAGMLVDYAENRFKAYVFELSVLQLPDGRTQ